MTPRLLAESRCPFDSEEFRDGSRRRLMFASVARRVGRGTWDEVRLGRAKDVVNRQKHGIRFADAVEVFADPGHLEEDSTKPEYGEERRRAIGVVQGRTITVVYTDRGAARRIISARRARKDERDRYDQGKPAS